MTGEGRQKRLDMHLGKSGAADFLAHRRLESAHNSSLSREPASSMRPQARVRGAKRADCHAGATDECSGVVYISYSILRRRLRTPTSLQCLYLQYSVVHYMYSGVHITGSCLLVRYSLHLQLTAYT